MRLIDADKLIESIQKKEAEPDYQHPNEDWCVGLCIAEDLVWEQSTIDERKTGSWIPHQSKWGIEGEMVYECSCCGENVGFYPHNFCPYCGSYNGGKKDE